MNSFRGGLMSPVLYSTIPAGFPIRRSAAKSSVSSVFVSKNPETSTSLFPICPDRSPNTRTEALAPLSGPGSNFSDSGFASTNHETLPETADPDSSADCPPPGPASCGDSLRIEDLRKDAVFAVADAVPGAATQTAAPLVGIARLASISPAAFTQRKSGERPEYFVLPVKSILNKCESDRVPFDWTINPYRGCEFACKYRYARYTHEFMELDGLAFEKKIFVKKDAAGFLDRGKHTQHLF